MTIASTDPSLHGAAATRVLLVDSRPVLLNGLAALLEQHRPPLQVVGDASSYARALQLAQQSRPDVILASIFQDAISPLDAIPALLRYARVVVLKGMNDPVTVSTLLSLGAAGVVTAEQSPESIVQAVLQASKARLNGAVWAGVNAVDEPQRRLTGELLARLTARERELIRAVVTNPGAKYLVIGAQLGISEHTVHNHLSSIYQKLNVVNRNDLLAYAVRNGLADDEPSSRH